MPVLTDPTTGGVTASFAMLGDIILAEPGEKMVVDSGNLAMMDATCSIDIQTVKGVR